MEIVEFGPEHAEAFRALNEAWISKYFTIEAKDREVLDDPHGKIVAKGGRIFMAFKDAEPVGCVALIRMADGGYEVAKMTVADTLPGPALGRVLMHPCTHAAAEKRTPGEQSPPRARSARRATQVTWSIIGFSATTTSQPSAR